MVLREFLTHEGLSDEEKRLQELKTFLNIGEAVTDLMDSVSTLVTTPRYAYKNRSQVSMQIFKSISEIQIKIEKEDEKLVARAGGANGHQKIVYFENKYVKGSIEDDFEATAIAQLIHDHLKSDIKRITKEQELEGQEIRWRTEYGELIPLIVEDTIRNVA